MENSGDSPSGPGFFNLLCGSVRAPTIGNFILLNWPWLNSDGPLLFRLTHSRIFSCLPNFCTSFHCLKCSFSQGHLDNCCWDGVIFSLVYSGSPVVLFSCKLNLLALYTNLERWVANFFFKKTFLLVSSDALSAACGPWRSGAEMFKINKGTIAFSRFWEWLGRTISMGFICNNGC